MNRRSDQLRIQISPEGFISPEIASLEDTMKSIIVQVEGNATALAVPYSEALLSVLINAKIVKLDTGYYPQTGTKFKLQDNQVRVEVVNDSVLDSSDAIEKIEKKKKAEYLAKLKAEVASLEGETE
jgi:hypothetical protein